MEVEQDLLIKSPLKKILLEIMPHPGTCAHILFEAIFLMPTLRLMPQLKIDPTLSTLSSNKFLAASREIFKILPRLVS